MSYFSKLSILGALILFISCNNRETLQEYYVDNQGNKDFVAIDVPVSLFASVDSLTPNQQKTLETIKKINVLAIPKKSANQEKIDTEKKEISDLLSDKKYQLLMKYGSNDRKLELYYTGTDEAINEIIVYGYDDEKGMGIARLLGNNMNPSDIIELVKGLERGDVNMDGLQGIMKIFSEASGENFHKTRDTIGSTQDTLQ